MTVLAVAQAGTHHIFAAASILRILGQAYGAFEHRGRPSLFNS